MKKLTRTEVEQLIASGGELNFKNVDLSNVDLRNLDLSGANFEGADLQGVELNGATLIRTNFENSQIYHFFLVIP